MHDIGRYAGEEPRQAPACLEIQLVIRGQRDQLDYGAGQLHPDYQTGPYESLTGASVTSILFSNQTTWTPNKP